MSDILQLVNLILLCIINIFFAIIGMVLNGLVVLSFFTSSALRSKICYFTVWIMSCVDLVVVTVGHPLIVAAAIVCWHSGTSSASVIDFIAGRFLFLFAGLSENIIVVMSLDRYLAVFYPFYYERTVTK